MAQMEIVTESRGDRLVNHWRGLMDAMHAAGDIEGLKREQNAYAVGTARFLADGKTAAAERFAALAVHASELIARPVPPRVLRRPAEVTESLMERDV